MPRGKYVVIEGHDGTGKSTQVELLRAKLKEQGINSVEMHEPGGVAFADRLREVIKDGTLERSPITNLLLFTAARRELWQQLAMPALERGDWVIAARNWYSTLAYQGYGEGVDRSTIEKVTKEFVSEAYTAPDFACILLLKSEDERRNRINNRGQLHTPDTFEARGDKFQTTVNNAYIEITKQLRLKTIDADRDPRAMAQEIYQTLQSLLGSDPSSL